MKYTLLPNSLSITLNNKTYHFHKNDLRFNLLKEGIHNKYDISFFERIIHFKELLEKNNITIEPTSLTYKGKLVFNERLKEILLKELLENDFDLITFLEKIYVNNNYDNFKKISRILETNKENCFNYNFVKKDSDYIIYTNKESISSEPITESMIKNDLINILSIPKWFADLSVNKSHKCLYDYFIELWGSNNGYIFNNLIYNSVQSDPVYIYLLFLGHFFKDDELIDCSNPFNQLAISDFINLNNKKYAKFLKQGLYESDKENKNILTFQKIIRSPINNVMRQYHLDHQLYHDVHFIEMFNFLKKIKQEHNLDDITIIDIIFYNYDQSKIKKLIKDYNSLDFINQKKQIDELIIS